MHEKIPGRPLGPIAESVLALLVERGPLTAREIAIALQLSNDAAKHTCQRLMNRDRIRVVARKRIAGVNKLVACYAITRQLTYGGNTHLARFPFLR